MRILLAPAGSQATDGDRLPTGAYAWPEQHPWTRVTMLRTLDGSVAGPDGKSGSVSSSVDREVLAEVRRRADAVVIGASTLRVERYGPMTAREDALDERRAAGQADAPVLVIVSGSLDLPWREPVFSASTITPIVVTGEGADPDALAEARRHADVLQLDGEVTAGALVAALHGRGLRRLVCEGGPGVLAGFAAEGLVDEVCLTVSPRQPARSPGVDHVTVDPESYELVQLLEHESFLFARYVRAARTT